VLHAHNTVFGSKRSAICAQAVYFLHLTRPSVTSIVIGWIIILVVSFQQSVIIVELRWPAVTRR